MARVLIVDDEEGVRAVLREHLLSRGHAVRGAASAEEALRLVEAETFDLILLDLSLPGMTGLEALPRLARSAGAVVVLTGLDDPETRRDAALLGAKGVLAKPFEYASLAPYLGPAPEAP